MNKENLASISIFCLSISIIISSIIIAQGLERNGDYIGNGIYNTSSQLTQCVYDTTSYNNENSKDNMNIDSAAMYLGITTSDVEKIMNTDGLEFPYVKVGSNYIINKNALDKWLETAIIKIE